MPDRRQKSIYFADFEVRVAEGRLLKGGRAIEVEPRIFDLLVYFANNRGRLVSKEEMVAAVWGGAFVSDSAISRAVARLRRVLGDDSRQPRYVETAHSRGYRFIASLREQSAPMRRPAPRVGLLMAVGLSLGLALVASCVRINIETAKAEPSEDRVRLMELRFDVTRDTDAAETGDARE